MIKFIVPLFIVSFHCLSKTCSIEHNKLSKVESFIDRAENGRAKIEESMRSPSSLNQDEIATDMIVLSIKLKKYHLLRNHYKKIITSSDCVN
jgi:hypothetical protein